MDAIEAAEIIKVLGEVVVKHLWTGFALFALTMVVGFIITLIDDGSNKINK